MLNAIGAIEEWVVNASGLSGRRKLCLQALLLIYLSAPVAALANVTYGTRFKVVNAQNLSGDGFVLTTDIKGDATRICMASFKVLSCFDARTWKRLWSDKTPYGSIDAGPVISGNIVLYAGGGGSWIIYGTSAHNGQILWRKNHQSYALATARGMVFADGYGTGLIALAARSGRKLWGFEGIGPGGGIGPIWFYEGKLFTVSYILDARTGKLVRILHSGPRVFAASRGIAFGANLHGALRAWNVASGRVVWSRTLHSKKIGVGLAANPKQVFAAFYNRLSGFAHHGVLNAYDASDGRVIWSRELTSDAQALAESPVGADRSHVYVIEPSDTAHGSIIVSLDARTGKRIWSCSTVETAYGPPIVTRNFVYVAVGNATLVVIDKRDGKIVKSIPFPK